ncbi:MAG TPA: hypothetical protein VFL90_20740, partial [Methylomirabilota bacterium]|nr:hypothetical protein [Methylomirabilota bacterium]
DLCGIVGVLTLRQCGTFVAATPRAEATSTVSWTEFGAYTSLALMIFVGGVALCWLVLWRQ